MLLLLFSSCPPVCGVFPNYKVVMFQPRTGTSIYLGFITNGYIAMLLCTSPPFLPATRCPPGGLPAPAPSLPRLPAVFSLHRIIFPPRCNLYPSQNTDILSSLNQIPLPPLLPHPLHACQITAAAPLTPQKFLLTRPSAASKPPFSASTSHCASSLPRIPYTYHKPQLSPSTPPTPPLLPAAYQCTSPVSMLPLL